MKIGWPVSKLAGPFKIDWPGFETGWPVSKRAGLFRNGLACFKMGWPVSKRAAYHGLFQNGPNKKLLLIGLTGVKMGWPVLKWAARFKMGQITNRAVTYILYRNIPHMQKL